MILDGELLRRYAETKSEEAFAELVRRHLDLVYSAALRQVNGDAHMAQDVAQMVFTDLARKAASLSQREFLTGWLYTSTHFAAANTVRKEHRRRRHEQNALAMHELLQTPAPDLDWQQLRPVLDTVMHDLNDTDRAVILMRYFENRQFADLGARLGLSEDAARKRVDRALEKLRTRLAKRGLTTSIALGAVLSANAVQVAPVGLAATLASASVAGAVSGTGITVALMKVMTMTKIQGGIIGGIIVAGTLATLVIQQRALASLSQENVALRDQADQLAKLAGENQNLSNQLAAAETAPPLPADQFSELLGLRGELGVQKNELEKLRAETALGTNSARYQAARERALKNYYPKESWATAGFGTPEATVQSLSWAESRGDVPAVLACMSPEAQADMAKHFNSTSTNTAADEMNQELSSSVRNFEQVDGLRIVNRKTLADGEVFLTFYTQGGDSWGSARMKQFGNEWKIVGNFDTP
jgi:RNA polymerase sigma factor (sigma-70 family)